MRFACYSVFYSVLDSCYSRTWLRSIKTVGNGSLRDVCACSFQRMKSLDCFWKDKYSFNNDILEQRSIRKIKINRYWFGDTCREETAHENHAWLRAKHNSNGESFSVIEHRGLDRKRITRTRAEQLSRVCYLRACGFLFRFQTQRLTSFFRRILYACREGRTKDELARIGNFQAQINGAQENIFILQMLRKFVLIPK